VSLELDSLVKIIFFVYLMSGINSECGEGSSRGKGLGI